MKRSTLMLLAFLCSFPYLVFAQDSNPEVVKTKTYRFLGESWQFQKFSDGSKTFETEIEDKNWNDTTFAKKHSKYDDNIVTDLGINLWNPSDQTPAVKPWGSWNVELKYLGQYKASKNFHLNSSIGVSWFNYKFEDRDLIAVRTPEGIAWEEFTEGTGTKSKITASYVNLTFVPTLISNNEKLSVGFGAYAGLRLGGRGKLVYDDAEGKSLKEFEKVNMYAENYRYGLRAEIGVGDVNLYVNYDLNNFFIADKGPEVQAISFGISFR